MHFCRHGRKHVQSFKKTGLKLYEKLQSQGIHWPLSVHLRSENDKVQKVQKSDKKCGKDYMKSTCTSSDYGENMCKVAKRLVSNCMRSCAHEVAPVYILRVKND